MVSLVVGMSSSSASPLALANMQLGLRNIQRDLIYRFNPANGAGAMMIDSLSSLTDAPSGAGMMETKHAVYNRQEASRLAA